MQDESGPHRETGESSLHQQMMQGFLEWVAGLRTIPPPLQEAPPVEAAGLDDQLSQMKGTANGKAAADNVFQDHA